MSKSTDLIRRVIDHALLSSALSRPCAPAIACLHSEAAHADATDWPQIALLYRAWLEHEPSPAAEVNYAVAVSFAERPAEGLAILQPLRASGVLTSYHPFHTARADMLRRAGALEDAATAYRDALRWASNEASRVVLRRRLAERSQR